jgi:hypothetical protein
MASYVQFSLAGGGSTFVNPELVERIEDATIPGVAPPTCVLYLEADDPNGARVAIQGTAVAAAAALAAAGTGGATFGSYTPTLTDGGAFYSYIPDGVWQWVQIGNRVLVWGRFEVQPLVPPFGQFGLMSANVPIPPTIPFGASERATGVCAPDGTLGAPTYALEFGASPIQAFALDIVQCRVVLTDNVGPAYCGLSFAYTLD